MIIQTEFLILKPRLTQHNLILKGTMYVGELWSNSSTAKQIEVLWALEVGKHHLFGLLTCGWFPQGTGLSRPREDDTWERLGPRQQHSQMFAWFNPTVTMGMHMHTNIHILVYQYQFAHKITPMHYEVYSLKGIKLDNVSQNRSEVNGTKLLGF